MKRLALLLGLFSVCSQVLLLRELLASFGGDELLLGTAFFGWLLAVALGALCGGRGRFVVRPWILFLTAAVVLPLTLAAMRLAPLVLTDVPGEAVAFLPAALTSIVLMLPVAFICGALFPTLSNLTAPGRDAILEVYLWEGLGAFAGGLLLAITLGWILSTMAATLFIAIIVAATAIGITTSRAKSIVGFAIGPLAAIAVIFAPGLDTYLTQLKFPDYQVQSVFDTRYSHQIILEREGVHYLVTDNLFESTYPDLETAENLLLPGLCYAPDSRDVLFFGQAELALAPLLDSLPELRVIAVDPRGDLSAAMQDTAINTVTFEDTDPIRYAHTAATKYDLIILNPGSPDSYLRARLLNPSTFHDIAALLKPEGILEVQTPYDSERYISPGSGPPLATIAEALRGEYKSVTVWPGAATTFLASDGLQLGLPVDTLAAHLGSLSYTPTYLSESNLIDRLEPMRRERLADAVTAQVPKSTSDRPLLPVYQLAQRAESGAIETTLANLVTGKRIWLYFLAAILLVRWLFSTSPRQPRRYSGWLFWSCGVVSLTVELLVFYLYQSRAGALYSDLSVLVGAFMLGLSLGTFYSRRILDTRLELVGMGLLMTLLALLLLTYEQVPLPIYLPYCALVLLVTAIATGTVFVAATNRQQLGHNSVHRGGGYAIELLGSGSAALLALTLLLPALGLSNLLLGLLILTLLGLVGSVISGPGPTPRI